MTITPDQARKLLDGATPGPWVAWLDNEAIATDQSPGLYNTDGAVEWGRNIEHYVPLAAAAPELAQTIAGMRWEYGVEQATGTTQWFRARPMAEAHAQVHGCFRLVRRLVGPVEVAE